MTHPNRERLLDLVLETLADDELAPIREHVAGCSECEDALAALHKEQDALAEALEPPRAAPAGLEDRVLAAVREARQEAPRPIVKLRPPPRRWPAWMAMAAGLLVAASVGLYVRHQDLTVEQPKKEMIQRVRVSELKALGLEEEVSR